MLEEMDLLLTAEIPRVWDAEEKFAELKRRCQSMLRK